MSGENNSIKYKIEEHCEAISESSKFTFECTIHDFVSCIGEEIGPKCTKEILESTNFGHGKFENKFFLRLKYCQYLVHAYLCSRNVNQHLKVVSSFRLIDSNDKEELFPIGPMYYERDNNSSVGVHTISKAFHFRNDLLKKEQPIKIRLDLEITEFLKFKTNYDSLLVNKFKKMFLDQTLSDFTFQVDNEEIKAHKSVLTVQSPVFRAMVENNMAEKMNNRTVITDIRPEIFKVMLQFLYTHKIESELDKDEVIELLIAADKYCLKILEQMCCELLCKMMTLDNVIEILLIAQKLNNEQLEIYARNFMDKDKVKSYDVLFKFVKDNF